MFTKKNILILSSLLVIAGWNAGLYAAEIDYLKELNEEAGELGKQATNGATNQANPAAQAELTDEQKKNQTEFEAALKNQLPGTYKLYMRLNHDQRLVVVEAYITNDKKMAVATRQLFNMYFNE